jgi:hypothetical protein
MSSFPGEAKDAPIWPRNDPLLKGNLSIAGKAPIPRPRPFRADKLFNS